MVKTLLSKTQKLANGANKLETALSTYLNHTNEQPTVKSDITGKHTGPAASHLDRVDDLKTKIAQVAKQAKTTLKQTSQQKLNR